MAACENPEKTSRVKDSPTRPSSRREVLQFLRFAGYYRHFEQNYSTFTAPLYRLTSGNPKKRKEEERSVQDK